MSKFIKHSALLLCLVMILGACGTKSVIVTSEYYPSGEYEETVSDEDTSSKGNDKNSSNASKEEQSSSSKKDNTDVSSDKDEEEPSGNSFDYSKYYTTDTKGSNQVIVYNNPKNYDTESAYKVEVKVNDLWIDVPVYSAEVERSNSDDYVYTYFASVDLKGAMTVKVTPKASYSKFAVLPTADGIKSTKSGKSITFTVSKPCQLSVELDGDKMSNLQLFVNPIDTNIPNPDDPNVIFVTPGVHTLGKSEFITANSKGNPVIQLSSNQTLYICGGAVVQAKIDVKPEAKKVTIKGRGIVDLLFSNAESGTMEDNSAKNNGERLNGVSLSSSSNVTVEGLILRNPSSYAVSGGNIINVTFDNLKIFTRGQCNDGIDLMSSTKINIKNCYIRANDDGIAIYASRWGYKGDSTDWDVSNVVFMVDCAHAVNIGTHGSQDASRRETIGNIKFNQIDVLDVYEGSSHFWGAFAFTVGDENIIDNVSFTDIRIEALARSQPVMIRLQKDSSWNTVPGYSIKNISFKNFTCVDSGNKSVIKGYADDRIVENVTFENFVIGGKKVTESNKGSYFNINEYTKNIVFK